MVEVVGGDRPQAVWRQELTLVEQLPEHPLQAVWAHNAEEKVALSGLPVYQTAARELVQVVEALVAEEAREHFGEDHGLLDHLLVHDSGRQHRDDADHRADLHWDDGPFGGDETVIEEAVDVVPHPLGVHGVPDGGEMLDELDHQVAGGPLTGAVQDSGDAAHCEGVGSHPTGGVRLLQSPADGQVGPVDGADIVQPEEAALEQVAARPVFQVDPPGEVDEELVEDTGEEVEVATAVDGEDFERRPRLHGRVDVAEVPLVGGQGAVGVLEPFTAKEDQLVLGEAGSTWANATQWKAMSHAAYQGYSHLSGIDMMSKASKFCHLEFRP